MRIGIDIGGTKAIVALVNEDRSVIRKARIETGENADCRDLVMLAAQTAGKLAGSWKNISTVGIGVPGTVDAAGKTVVCAPNIKWYDEPVARYFEEVSGISPLLAQDTRAAAWAEANYGAMREKNCVVCVTLGTGIGCGIVLNHRIFHGSFGTAGEIGHIPVCGKGRVCNCGRRDCMESYSSGTGIGKSAQEAGLCDTSEALFELAKGGHAGALRIISQAVEYASNVLAAVINILSPDAVLFSGGLSRQTDLYLNPLIDAILGKAYQNAVKGDFQIGPARLGTDAPVIGAAFLDEAFRDGAG